MSLLTFNIMSSSRSRWISCIYVIVRQYGSDSSWVRKGLGPIRLGSEKVWVRVVPEILGPSRLGSVLSDIRRKSPMLHTKFLGNRPTGSGEEDF